MKRFENWIRENKILSGVLVALVASITGWNFSDEILNSLTSSTYVSEHPWPSTIFSIAIAAIYSLFLPEFIAAPKRFVGGHYVFLAVGGAIVAAVIYALVELASINLILLLALMYLFGIVMFIALGSLLVNSGLGKYLTDERGEKWVKEIEYIYLLLGTTSIISGMSKIPNVESPISGLDVIAPLVLTFAVALRCVRTLAEIQEWNKPAFWADKR